MQSLKNKNIGKTGEEIAEKYLQSKGFSILERNFHKGYSEIDIVARDKTTVVFVEVKTRIGNKFGTPEEAITPWKLRTLIKSVQYYNLLHPGRKESMRIDVVAIVLTQTFDVERISHYKNVTGF